MLLAFFLDDPPSYPGTTAGQIHLQVALLALLVVAAGTIVPSCALLRQPSRVKLGGTMLAVSVLAFLPLLLLGHLGLRSPGLAGPYGRLFLTLELIWLGVAAWPLSRIGSGPVERPLAPVQ